MPYPTKYSIPNTKYSFLHGNDERPPLAPSLMNSNEFPELLPLLLMDGDGFSTSQSRCDDDDHQSGSFFVFKWCHFDFNLIMIIITIRVVRFEMVSL